MIYSIPVKQGVSKDEEILDLVIERAYFIYPGSASSSTEVSILENQSGE